MHLGGPNANCSEFARARCHDYTHCDNNPGRNKHPDPITHIESFANRNSCAHGNCCAHGLSNASPIGGPFTHRHSGSNRNEYPDSPADL